MIVCVRESAREKEGERLCPVAGLGGEMAWETHTKSIIPFYSGCQRSVSAGALCVVAWYWGDKRDKARGREQESERETE